MRDEKPRSLLRTLLTIAASSLLVAGVAYADTPRSVVRIDKFGDVKDSQGKGGQRPLLVQDVQPAQPGVELQEIEIGGKLVIFHEPTSYGIPPHTMDGGTVHGCHQWVYVSPTWYLVHC